MLTALVNRVHRFVDVTLQGIRQHVSRWTKPTPAVLVRGTLVDLPRSKPALMAENALLRQQLIVLHRTNKRAALTSMDRTLLVLLASQIPAWKEALLIVKPETLLRWHRQGFRLFWKRKSRAKSTTPRVSAETVVLIQEMTANNRLWGAERIRGESGARWAKLGIRVSKRTIQKYLRQARPLRPRGQTWATFLRNQAHETWACDFLQVTDAFFRPLFAFFVTELASRRIVHVGITRSPTGAWVAQQLREATPFGEGPKYLIRDNDGKYSSDFDRVATGTRIKVLRTPFKAPRANAICERFLGSVRRECLDHVLILSEQHLRRVLKEYAAYFNQARPHQGKGQQLPEVPDVIAPSGAHRKKIVAFPVLGGLHHDYRMAA